MSWSNTRRQRKYRDGPPRAHKSTPLSGRLVGLGGVRYVRTTPSALRFIAARTLLPMHIRWWPLFKWL